MNAPLQEWIDKAEGEMATKEDARAALKAIKTVRTFVRSKLHLSNE